MDSLQAVLYVYLFIVLGFLTKKIFGQKVDEKTLVVLSVYIFQPFLSFWGLLKRPIDLDLAMAPFIFFGLGVGVIILNILLAKWLFDDPKDRSIFIVSSVIGNTGNLGVPLGLALFGPESLPYTTICLLYTSPSPRD